MASEKYEIRIWFWTGSMNTYKSKSVKGLNEDQAYSLYSTIVIDGIVTQTELMKNGETIRMRDDEGDWEFSEGDPV